MAKDTARVVDTIFPGAGSAGGEAADAVMPKIPEMPAPPGMPPGADPAARAAREAVMEEARRRSQYGRASTNPTGGTGDTSTPNLAAKSLLGF